MSAHREAVRTARSIVVKIGTTALTNPAGLFDALIKEWQAAKYGAQASAAQQRDVRVGQMFPQRAQCRRGHDRVANP